MVFVDSAFFFDFDGGAIHIGDFAIGAVGSNRNAARSGIGTDTHGKRSSLFYAIINIITHSNIVDINTVGVVRLGLECDEISVRCFGQVKGDFLPVFAGGCEFAKEMPIIVD